MTSGLGPVGAGCPAADDIRPATPAAAKQITATPQTRFDIGSIPSGKMSAQHSIECRPRRKGAARPTATAVEGLSIAPKSAFGLEPWIRKRTNVSDMTATSKAERYGSSSNTTLLVAAIIARIASVGSLRLTKPYVCVINTLV